MGGGGGLVLHLLVSSWIKGSLSFLPRPYPHPPTPDPRSPISQSLSHSFFPHVSFSLSVSLPPPPPPHTLISQSLSHSSLMSPSPSLSTSPPPPHLSPSTTLPPPLSRSPLSASLPPPPISQSLSLPFFPPVSFFLSVPPPSPPPPPPPPPPVRLSVWIHSTVQRTVCQETLATQSRVQCIHCSLARVTSKQACLFVPFLKRRYLSSKTHHPLFTAAMWLRLLKETD